MDFVNRFHPYAVYVYFTFDIVRILKFSKLSLLSFNYILVGIFVEFEHLHRKGLEVDRQPGGHCSTQLGRSMNIGDRA